MTNNGQTPGGNTTTAGAVEQLAEYLIRKGGAYYRPNAAGYTNNIAEAGRYSLDDAIRHSHPNGPNGPRDGIDYMPAPTFPSEAEWRAQSEDERYQFLKSLYAQAHPLPGDALEQAILWARDDKCSYPADAEKFDQRIEILRAAHTPSALSVPVGDDLAKGLRTSQKALDEIARQEQANIAGYLALRDFPVGSASGHFPPDEVGPNALGSDIPYIAAQLLEISRISNKYDLRECIEGHDDALGDSYIWRDLMDQCEKLGTNPSALSGDAGEGRECEREAVDDAVSRLRGWLDAGEQYARAGSTMRLDVFVSIALAQLDGSEPPTAERLGWAIDGIKAHVDDELLGDDLRTLLAALPSHKGAGDE